MRRNKSHHDDNKMINNENVVMDEDDGDDIMEEEHNNVDDDNEDPNAISSSSSSSGSSSSDNDVDNVELETADKSKSPSTGGKVLTVSAGSVTDTDTDTNRLRGSSRMFAPYRSVGIITHGPFHLLPHQNSSTAMIATTIGDKFQLVSCDKLAPILVSRSVPGFTSPKSSKSSSSSTTTTSDKALGPQSIHHIVTDGTLSISVVAHGFESGSNGKTTRVSLFQRTRPLTTLELDQDLLVLPNNKKNKSRNDNEEDDDDDDDGVWSIVDMIHLGKIKVTMTGEKQGRKENAVLIGIVASKGRNTANDEYYKDGVPIMGTDDDDDHDDSEDESDSDDSDSDSSDDDDDDDDSSDDDGATNHQNAPPNNGSCRGQIILLVATRTGMTIHKRIPLKDFPSFNPRVAIHPPTYVNKIIVGGSCTKTDRDAMILINIRSGKLIHVFKCLDGNEASSSGKSRSNRPRSEITALEPSPAIDTIAVGTSRGTVHLINTRYDRLLFSLHHRSKISANGTKPKNVANAMHVNSSDSNNDIDRGRTVQITSMSFRTDGSALKYGIAPLAVGRSDGTITIWDLSPPESYDDDSDSDDDEEEVRNRRRSKRKSNQDVARTILCEMERVHYPGGVHKIEYMPQEPLLLSTGTRSNAVLMHIFDNPDHSGRILRQRRGHTAPPTCIQYLHPGSGAGGGVLANMSDGTDAHACQILSSGSADRTFRKFSTVRSVLDKEFSQGKGLEKRAKELGFVSKAELLLPPVTAMSTSEVRSRDWGDLVTIHQEHAFAYVWSTKNGSQNGPVLRQDDWNISAMKKQPPTSAHATSITISTCGNFALVGTRGGTIYKYNVQSGIPRGTYPVNENSNNKNGGKIKDAGDIRRTFRELEKKMKSGSRTSNMDKEEDDRVDAAKRAARRSTKLLLASHKGFAVTGVAVDSVNRTVVSVGEDAKLILWNFTTHTPHKNSPSKLPAPATKLCHVKNSDLAAIALTDYSALLFDCSTLTIVRRFGYGNNAARHTGPISDLGFSPDGRTLFTSSLDSTIRVWDVPTNSCVDWLGFTTPPTSLTVSPTGEFLATSHTSKLGISLWSDKSFYQTVHVDGTLDLTEPAMMDDPSPVSDMGANGKDEDSDMARRMLESSLTNAAKKSIVDNETEDDVTDGPARAREDGLITLSGLPPAHWKNLFHLELVKQRNKPKEAPKKPPTAPFFLQWRPSVNATGELTENPETSDQKKSTSDALESAEWDAVWSDDDDDNTNKNDDSGKLPGGLPPLDESDGKKKKKKEEEDADDNGDVDDSLHTAPKKKKQKVSMHRSQLASLLQECAEADDDNDDDENDVTDGGCRFHRVTEYIGGLGPSAIDVSLSTLCNGTHDLEDGLPLLILASRWLIEACQSRERFDAVNAYLHRFLHLHASIIASIEEEEDQQKQQEREETKQDQSPPPPPHRLQQRSELLSCVQQLKHAQRTVTSTLQDEMQNTLCLLRHFSRMV